MQNKKTISCWKLLGGASSLLVCAGSLAACLISNNNQNQIKTTVNDELTGNNTMSNDFTDPCTVTIDADIFFSNNNVSGTVWFTYDIETDTASFTCYSTSQSLTFDEPTSINISSTYEYDGTWYYITSIDGNAFRNCNSSLTSITFDEDSVLQSIGSYAFANCNGITSIELPESLEYISSNAFASCNSLKTVGFGENSQLESIGRNAFSQDWSLDSITIPDSVTSIGVYAFYHCAGLKSITFGESSKLTSIGEGAFYSCSSLESISIPESVNAINSSTFASCDNLKSVTFDENSVVQSIGQYAFGGCTSLESIEIPSSVNTINASAFMSCTSLSSIVIPSSVTTIEQTAFTSCTSLTSVYLNWTDDDLAMLNESWFDTVALYKPTFYVPFGYGDIYKNSTKLNSHTVVVCDPTPNMEYDADASLFFSDVSISGTITFHFDESYGITIDNIEGSNDQTTLKLNQSIKWIDIDPYYADDTKASDITGIGENAFANYADLVSIEIPDTIITIGKSAFSNCSELRTIHLTDTTTTIGDYAFYECISLSHVEVPNNLQSIGEEAFWECASLESIDIPNGVTTIGSWAFGNCASLTTVNIPESIENIGDQVFYQCNNLTSIYLNWDENTVNQLIENGTLNNNWLDLNGKRSEITVYVPTGLEELYYNNRDSLGISGCTIYGYSSETSSLTLDQGLLIGLVAGIGLLAIVDIALVICINSKKNKK